MSIYAKQNVTAIKQSKIPMSATEKNQPNCLPPEAYIRIIRNCDNTEPKFRSSVYPKPKKDKKTK